MRLELSLNGSQFLVSKEPVPVMDPTSNTQKLDKEGRPLFVIQLVWIGDNGAEVLPVKVNSRPAGLTIGCAVRVVGLVATPWSMADRSGVSFSAARVEAIAK
ncbi:MULTISPECIES: hypothetical protein [Ferrimicrobium]|uniref:hypothetical protein n=1 Tax=Ferrimicrobium TaxID=121038 RepID=UPI0023F063C6|nr:MULTISPECIES: hypothetical protein [Ferrimicrobium]